MHSRGGYDAAMIRAIAERGPGVRAVAFFACMIGVGGTGCGGAGFPEVDNARWLSSGGTPRVTRVRDLGTRRPPDVGALQPESDGVASPGEYLLVEGSGFGKQPAVTVGGRAAEVMAHTVGGGVIVKVPGGAETGVVDVEVSVGELRSKVTFPVRRLGAVLHRGAVRLFEVKRDALVALPVTLPVPGATALRISSDGACAYVLTPSKLWVIDLGAAGQPKILTTRDIAIPGARLLAGAERAPVIFAVADGAVQGFETNDARAPARYDSASLPPESRGFSRADLDPEGHRLALIVPEGNRLVMAAVDKRDRVSLAGEVALLPEARVPLLRDLRFAADGETIWVVSGDGADSATAGAQPTRVSAVRLLPDEGGGAPRLDAWRTAQLVDAGAPLRLSMTHGRTVSSGATIRMPPEQTVVRFSSVDHALVGLGAARAASGEVNKSAQPGRPGRPGRIDQSDATGEGGMLAATPFIAGGMDYAPDNASLFAAAAQGSDAGVARISIPKPGEPSQVSFVRLSAAAAGDLKAPFPVGEVAVQP